jgi:hypothetical protein
VMDKIDCEFNNTCSLECREVVVVGKGRQRLIYFLGSVPRIKPTEICLGFECNQCPQIIPTFQLISLNRLVNT